MKKIIVTGDRPTGKLHLGHYFGSLKNRLTLQDEHEMFILIADTQVLNNNVLKAKDVKKNTIEVMKDYLSIGLNPQKINFVLQSEIQELFELTNYFSNIVSLSSVQRIPTIKHENETYNKSLNLGFLTYPVSQTADIVLFNGQLVPVGIDQLPILEFGNDLIAKFHHNFNCNVFKKIEPILSESSKVIGIDGNNKMSKSLDNAIFISDSFEDIKNKVHKMYTDPNHIKVTDPGQVDGNVVFTFLDLFHSDIKELDELKVSYKKGGLGDMFLKRMLINDINSFLLPIRDNRDSISDAFVLDVLANGTNNAKAIAKNNMSKIKDIIFS